MEERVLSFLIVSFLTIVTHTRAASSDNTLSFISPNIKALHHHSGKLPYYEVGDDVKVEWTTPFKNTTLLVFQATQEGEWTWDILALGNDEKNTSFSWSAGAVTGDGNGYKMYLTLEKAESDACDGCVLKSPLFKVLNQDQVAKLKAKQILSTSKSTRTSTGSSTTVTKSVTTSRSAAIGAQTQLPTTHQPGPTFANAAHHNSESSRNLKIGLGAGLGGGLLVLLGGLGLLFFCLRRRKHDRRISYRPTPSGNWTEEASQSQEQMREAGSNRHSTALLNQPLANPVRASDSTGSTVRASWIEPFDFERSEVVEQEAGSQPKAASLLQPAVDVNDGSSVYSSRDHSGSESPVTDAAAVLSPSGRPRNDRQLDDRYSAPEMDLSTLEGLPAQPQPARTDASQIVDWRNWPLGSGAGT